MRKKRVLVLTDCYYPTQTANSIITHNVVNEMIKRGYDITCIAINQDVENLKNNEYGYQIYSVENTKYAKLLKSKQQFGLNAFNETKFLYYKGLRKFNNLINIKKFPDVDPAQSRKAYRISKNLHEIENYDYAIGVFRPYSAVSAVIKLKECFPEIIIGAIYLDIISGASKPSLIPNNLYEKLCIEGDIKSFKKLDFILMANKGKNIYNDSMYQPINKKIQYFDFPVFIKKASDDRDFNHEKVNFVYAGTLNKEYRNPTSMFQNIELISKEIEGVVLHIFGRNNCKDIIEKFKKKSSYQIIEHGVVEHKIVQSAFNSGDFLINISNSTENIIPSKIFELFATGKPIVNFNSRVDDGICDYSSKYPAFFRVSENSNNKEISSLLNFIMSEKGNRYDFDKIKHSFIENTPEYFVDIIEKELRKFE